MTFLRAQHPALFVRAIVGAGAAGDAALRYAVRYGASAGCPVRRLVLLGSAHGSLDDSPSGIGGGDAWQTLSVHGTADTVVAPVRAELYHTRHRAAGAHALRLLQAGHDFKACEPRVAATINDWLEGVRRLNSDDRSAWAVEARIAAAAKAAAGGRPEGGEARETGGGGGADDDDDLEFWGF